MKIISTEISDVKFIDLFSAKDARGEFVKTFHTSSFKEGGIDFKMKESFYSISHSNVIRGMHFQHPPHQHAKIVFCTQGAILDVVLDIRKKSATYGKFVSVELNEENHKAIYIPVGFAHGFKTLTPHALTFYFVSSENEKSADDGILYNSFGFDWNVNEPILSDRDKAFKDFNHINSPF